MQLERSLNGQGSWSGTAINYSSNVGRSSLLAASRLVAVANEYLPFLSMSSSSPAEQGPLSTSLHSDEAPSSVLEVGSGTGAVTLTIANEFPFIPILATDMSTEMLDILSGNLSHEQRTYVKTQVADAHKLNDLIIKPRLAEGSSVAESSFSHVFACFMLHYTKSHLDVIKEITSVLRPGGVIAIANWTLPLIDPYAIWTRACREIDPLYEMLNPFDSLAWETEKDIQEGLASFGFKDIRTELIEMPFGFDPAEDFSRFWFEGQNPGAARVVGEFQGDDKALRRQKVEEIVRRDYKDGQSIFLRGTLGWGRK